MNFKLVWEALETAIFYDVLAIQAERGWSARIKKALLMASEDEYKAFCLLPRMR